MLSGPECLAAVDSHLGLSTKRYKVDGGGKNEAIGSDKFLIENSHTVVDDTFALLETAIAFKAGGDSQVFEENLLYLRPFTLGSF